MSLKSLGETRIFFPCVGRGAWKIPCFSRENIAHDFS